MSGINQQISITSPLEKDELSLISFDGAEYVSDLFEFNVDVLSTNHSIKPEQLIGKTATVTLQGEQKRAFNGYISHFALGELTAENLRAYQLTIVPWLWFLSKTNNSRIFHEETTENIVSRIFKDLGFNDFKFTLSGSASIREYCVQHNESDLNFISRLLEEEGMAYYFEQKDGKHMMQIVDAANAYQECAETNLSISKGSHLNSQLTSWVHKYDFRKGRWSLNDYDYKNPPKSQLQSTASTSKFANVNSYEHYEYSPSHDFSGIKDLTKKRIEAEEVSMNTIQSSSNCSSLYAGGKFKLAKHEIKSEQGEYIITSIRHHIYESGYYAGNETQSGYSNEFTCIPDSVHFRPELKHRKPVMAGPQSAVVVDNIDSEDKARIKVRFHWNREDDDSCFIRVMQSWAGAGWGSYFVPRIGMEVVVDFYDGDPDRPIVTGAVYNWDNKPPFTPKTQCGLQTSNTNVLRFDDNDGAEQVFIHAKKDMDTEIENDETLKVDNDRTKDVAKNEKLSIGANRDKSVGGNQSETISGDKSISVNGNHTESISKNKSMNVSGKHSEDIAKDKTLNVGGAHTESIGKDMSIKVAENLTEDIGKNLGIVAGDEIVLKTGSASITMKKNGDIIIKGANINIQGSGKINIKASNAVAIKGSKVTNN
jgi:type VI secretion system secreted protein VgrG